MVRVGLVLCTQALFRLSVCSLDHTPSQCDLVSASEQDVDDENALIQVGSKKLFHVNSKSLIQQNHHSGNKKELVNIPAIGLAKVHKTGSTTMQRIVEQLMTSRGKRLAIPVDFIHLGWPKSFPGEDNVAAIGTPEHQYDAIINHAVFNAEAYKGYLRPDPLLVGSIREPMSQAKSAYNYFRIQTPSQQMQRGKVSDVHLLTWEEHVDTLEKQCSDPVQMVAETAWFCNPQSYDLGWYEHVGWTTKYDNNATMIRQWIEDLESQLGNVILTEWFDQGVVLLNKILQVDIQELAYFRMMEGRSDIDPPKDKEFQERLRSFYLVDTILYDHFNKSFWSQWNSDVRGNSEQLASLQAANAQLNASCSLCEENLLGDGGKTCEENLRGSTPGCADVWTAPSVEYLQILQKNEPASAKADKGWP